jgi:hypothetical protein
MTDALNEASRGGTIRCVTFSSRRALDSALCRANGEKGECLRLRGVDLAKAFLHLV